VIAYHPKLVAVLLSLAVVVPLAGRAAAAEPKAPDLAELREAVAAADRRGENVRDIRDALAAFEKALAKGIKPPGPDAPPELAALREAVELALRKGENVDAVSRELGLVEKAVTGRAFERPRPAPVAQADPVRPFPPRRGGGGGVVISGANLPATSITISGGTFTVRVKQDDVTYTLTGPTGAPELKTITIRDGDKTIEADDPQKVPEKYRPIAEKMFKMVSRNNR
jgi:hypothetical protein